MTSVRKNRGVLREEICPNENIHNPPRCSTPVMESRVLYPPREKPSEYSEWKNRLEREKSSRIFKLRGTGNRRTSWCPKNCSIISGHFKPKSEDQISEETNTRSAPPVYHQMWLPLPYPGLWNNCHHENPVWYKTPIPSQSPQFHQPPAQVFGASGGAAFFNIFNNPNHQNHIRHNEHNFHNGIQNQDYYAIKPQPMQCSPVNHPLPMTTGHFYYQYHYPHQFFTYSPEISRMTTYVNVPIHGGNVFPVIMNS